MPDQISSPTWERRIADRLAERDQGALTELYDRFAPYVRRLAQRVSRDRDGAEDVVQEVFLGVWQKPGRFNPDLGSLRAWLGTVTHHTAVAWVRQHVANRRREANATEPTPADDVEHVALTQLMSARVRAAVASLPSRQRHAVGLAYFQGLSYRQVAERTGVPEGTAKSRLRLGLAALALALHTME